MTGLKPASTAMIIADYQPALLGFLADVDGFVAAARHSADALRAAGGHVGYVRVAFTDADYERFPPSSMMGRRVKQNRPGLDDAAASSVLHPGLHVHHDDWVFRKTRVGAFSTTKLDATLKAAGVDTVLLAGVHTSGVVLTTVREAHDLDYQVVVLADACADPDADVHTFLVDEILPRQAQVLRTTELLGSLGTRN